MHTAIEKAKNSLDKIIEKGRVHLYKPIQIAEILYRDRVEEDIDLSELETYRNPSKKWRDLICLRFLGRASTSSARYQDDVFNENAMPPISLAVLGKVNKNANGIVEAYIYKRFSERFTKMSAGLDYAKTHDKNTFNINEFISIFRDEPGLKRSIDKIYEIVVYSLFSALIDSLGVKVEVSYDLSMKDILAEFEDFAKRVLQLSTSQEKYSIPARLNRVGVTNAADRGLDMWANFGIAIQVKHLTLTQELAEGISSGITADRIVIVCKDSEEKQIASLINQLGLNSKVLSIITEKDLNLWYEKALRGKFSRIMGNIVMKNIIDEISVEFPATNNVDFSDFLRERGYDKLSESEWT